MGDRHAIADRRRALGLPGQDILAVAVDILQIPCRLVLLHQGLQGSRLVLRRAV